MKYKNLMLYLTLMVLVPTVSNAQFGNLIRNKASKALNALARQPAKEAKTALDSTAQQAIIQANDSATSQNQQKQSPDQSGQGGIDLAKLFGGKVDLKHKDDYHFSSRLCMVTESYTKDQVMKVDLYMYFSGNTPNVGIETKSFTDDQGKTIPLTSSTVMDGENKCFIILTNMNGTNMGLISAIPDEDGALTTQTEGKPDQQTIRPNFTKTGNTKVIAGYKCAEYSFIEPENKMTGKVWFTKDARLNIDKRGWQKTGMGAYYGYEGFEGGVVLASEAYDEAGKLTMKAETKEINPDFSHTISVKGVTLMQMNLNQRQPDK